MGALKPNTRGVDEKFQKVTTGIAKAGVNLVKIMEWVDSPHRLAHIQDTIEAGTDSLASMGQAYHLLSAPP